MVEGLAREEFMATFWSDHLGVEMI